MAEMRHSFWHSNPNGGERRVKIQQHLAQASKEYSDRLLLNLIPVDQYKKPLCFIANGQVVCEKVYAQLLGMADSIQKGKLKTWMDEVDIHLGNIRFGFVCVS
jgi:hypothetical protein